MLTSPLGLTCFSLVCAGTHSSSGALSYAESSSTCPGCLVESLQHARQTASQQVRPLQVSSDASQLPSPLTQPCRDTELYASQQGERLDQSASNGSATRPLSPSSQGSRAAQASGHPPADGGADSTEPGTSKQSQPNQATADAPSRGPPGDAEGSEIGNRPESMQAGSIKGDAELVLCDDCSDQGGARCEAVAGQSSRTSSVMVQQRADEESDAHGQVIHDAEAAEAMSSSVSPQHSMRSQPVSIDGSSEAKGQPPSEHAAALLISASPRSDIPGPAEHHRDADSVSSADDEEQRPSKLSQSSPHGQLSEHPEHEQSRREGPGCSSAEPSPSAWAELPCSAAPSPQSQHADGGASSTAAHEAWDEGHSGLSSHSNMARAPSESNHRLSSTSRGPAGPGQENAREDRAAEGQGMSPEEDELSRRMRSFLARLSDNPASARDCDSVGPGSAISLQAAHGSEGVSERGDGAMSDQVYCCLACFCMPPECVACAQMNSGPRISTAAPVVHCTPSCLT